MPAAATKAESAQYDIGARLVPGPAAATTALQILGHGRYEAIAEPVRLYGGSALDE